MGPPAHVRRRAPVRGVAAGGARAGRPPEGTRRPGLKNRDCPGFRPGLKNRDCPGFRQPSRSAKARLPKYQFRFAAPRWFHRVEFVISITFARKKEDSMTT